MNLLAKLCSDFPPARQTDAPKEAAAAPSRFLVVTQSPRHRALPGTRPGRPGEDHRVTGLDPFFGQMVGMPLSLSLSLSLPLSLSHTHDPRVTRLTYIDQA